MNWKHLIVPADATMKTCMQAINNGCKGLALVADANNKILGTVSDGDIRRALLAGMGLDTLAQKFMNQSPLLLTPHCNRNDVLAAMHEKLIKYIPAVDSNNCIIGLLTAEELGATLNLKDIPIVIMAGGMGTRLGELTKHKPKPLIDINGKPVLELVLDHLKGHGAEQIWLCVNHMADMIEDYFGNGQNFGLSINYIRENKRMGTAGALSLLPSLSAKKVLVMNADLITDIDFSSLVHFHHDNNAALTVGIRKMHYQIPYGVVETQNHFMLSVQEKPTYSYFVSAGIYLCDTSLFKYIPKDEFFDMPCFISKVIETGTNPVVFPIHEEWIDIGRVEDLEIARGQVGNSVVAQG